MRCRETWKRLAGRSPLAGVVGAALVFCDVTNAHENHAPLPAKGVTIAGDTIMLSDKAREAIGLTTAKVAFGDIRRTVTVNARVELPWYAQAMITSLVPEHRSATRIVQTVPVRAPTNGRIVSFNVVPGQVVHRDEAIFEIHDLSRVWVKGCVFEQDASRVELGQAADARFPAYPELEASGTVVRISPTMDDKERVLPVWVEVANTDHLLKDGMLARVTLLGGPAKDRVPGSVARPPASGFRLSGSNSIGAPTFTSIGRSFPRSFNLFASGCLRRPARSWPRSLRSWAKSCLRACRPLARPRRWSCGPLRTGRFANAFWPSPGCRKSA
jgi:multidrug efflux pump subunit AcrA (membrane-fusion protein)